MHIITEPDYINASIVHGERICLTYKEGGESVIPKDFFRNWVGAKTAEGYFEIGKCSYIAFGSLAVYFPEDNKSSQGKISIGRFCSCGPEVRFLQNQEHWTNTISTYPLHAIFEANDPPRLPSNHTVIKNDVWIGSQAMINGGSCTENGCIIGSRSLLPRNFRSEPYGIYVGSPARLKKFRFEEPVRELLVELAWWDMPISWIKQQSRFFSVDLTKDQGFAIELLQEMIQSKKEFLSKFLSEKGEKPADLPREVQLPETHIQHAEAPVAKANETAESVHIFDTEEIANFEGIVASYRANPSDEEAKKQIRALRQGIAEFILNTAQGRLGALFGAEFGTVCRLLIKSGLQREQYTQEEVPVVSSLTDIFCKTPRESISAKLLVCYMLYCLPPQGAEPLALEKIPGWLSDDYRAWSSPVFGIAPQGSE